jgi:hypothetical protein
LLVDNGNYSSLADLTLRKIKALESLSKEDRDRLMSEDHYKDQLDECYSIIISLFVAIDKSISKEDLEDKDEFHNDYVTYFKKKLDQVSQVDLKIGLREKILRRIE